MVRKRSCGKVMFLQLSVILFTEGGLPQCMLGYPLEQAPPGADTPPQQSPHPSSHPPAQCMLGDTVNKWTVCILLDCNLVFFTFTLKLPIQTSLSVALKRWVFFLACHTISAKRAHPRGWGGGLCPVLGTVLWSHLISFHSIDNHHQMDCCWDRLKKSFNLINSVGKWFVYFDSQQGTGYKFRQNNAISLST